MPLSEPVDGFRLSYDRYGPSPDQPAQSVVLLHGWPGDRSDYRHVIPLLADTFDVVVPDLRGFGASDKHVADPAQQYGANGQARSVLGLMQELGLNRPVLAGYDVGSRTAQAIAREHPQAVRSLVLAPPLPGVGRRILEPDAQREFWYQAFHQLPLAEHLLDGNPEALRGYLGHIWSHWSGPSWSIDDADLDRLLSAYAQPGAFTASIAWYRAGAGSVAISVHEQPPAPGDRIAVPTEVLWSEHDPLAPRAWSNRLDEFFSRAALTFVDGVGHFAPLEYPGQFAAAIRRAAEYQ